MRGIHVFYPVASEYVDDPVKPGHDEWGRAE